jgi:hypothetical protein
MKLSEAIRLGAMMKPQAFNGDDTQGSCALAAAAEACGMARNDEGNIPYSALSRTFPVLTQCVDSPVPLFAGCDVEELIWRLNDCACWSRERIADWVATIEAEQVESADIREAVHV